MNKFVLRLTWFSVKAAELLLPIAWNMARLAFYSFILFVVLLVLVILL